MPIRSRQTQPDTARKARRSGVNSLRLLLCRFRQLLVYLVSFGDAVNAAKTAHGQDCGPAIVEEGPRVCAGQAVGSQYAMSHRRDRPMGMSFSRGAFALPTADIAALTAADFEARRSDEFRAQTPKGEVVLQLSEVRKLGQAMRKGGAFSLLFVSPPGPFLPQAMYPLTHPD